MAHYSDRFLNSGMTKTEVEQVFKPRVALITQSDAGITEFVLSGDRAYLAGFGATNLGKGMLQGTSIIKENGEWKWYGNQREVVR
jgi:hypothetical protein